MDVMKALLDYEALGDEARRVCYLLFDDAYYDGFTYYSRREQPPVITLVYSYHQCDPDQLDFPVDLLFATDEEILTWDAQRKENERLLEERRRQQSLADKEERERAEFLRLKQKFDVV